MKKITTKELLEMFPSYYSEHSNNNTIYNTKWHDYNWDDFSIEILENWVFEVCKTGDKIQFNTVEEVLDYVLQ